jgi:mRNA-degrading endonuclease toxin of MazEF toxin-antitoxin module
MCAPTPELAEQAEQRLREREQATAGERPGAGGRLVGRDGRSRAAPVHRLDADEAIERLNQVIVVPLTTPMRGLANEVEIDVADGLPRTCVTSFDNLSTIARGQLVEKIATLEPATMDEICRALNATLACRGW